MPPIRRYLRITRYTVLEVRIYLDNPAQSAWLLRGADPALPRIIAAIRPMVLPKLREENERVKGKGTAKKRVVKDVVAEDDFEVSIFLTEGSTRHSLLTKAKTFTGVKSGNLKGWLQPIAQSEQQTASIVIPDNDEPNTGHVLQIRDEGSDDGHVELSDIPAAQLDGDSAMQDDESGGEDDKKVGPKTTYDGFSIYGRVLCLVVKRHGAASMSAKHASSQQMMESWVSTQAARDLDDAADDG